MRSEITNILAEYEQKTIGNQKALEIADNEIPPTERIVYIGPSNITITARNTSIPKLRTGVIAITEKSIYVIHKALWDIGKDVFPVEDLELVSYKATGIGGATFDLTLRNVSINFLAGYRKEYAEKLYTALNGLLSNVQILREATPKDSREGILASIEKLAELKEKGILSETEFVEKKRALLGRL